MQPLTLIFAGTQGSGKGTQIDLLKKRIAERDPGRPIVHFEMGKSLRELGTRANYSGRRTQEILNQGGLIPYAISTSRFSSQLIEQLTTNDEHLIIDGFPRTATQMPALDSALVEFYRRPKPTVIVLTISDDEAVRRLLARGRHDDTEAGIRKRLQWSREETIPNIESFRRNVNYTVHDIDGERGIEDIQADILARLGLQ